MEHALLMGVVHRLGYVADDLDRLIERQPLPLRPELVEHILEIGATYELHDDEEQRALLAEVEDLDDAGMVEPCRGSGFL